MLETLDAAFIPDDWARDLERLAREWERLHFPHLRAVRLAKHPFAQEHGIAVAEIVAVAQAWHAEQYNTAA